MSCQAQLLFFLQQRDGDGIHRCLYIFSLDFWGQHFSIWTQLTTINSLRSVFFFGVEYMIERRKMKQAFFSFNWVKGINSLPSLISQKKLLKARQRHKHVVVAALSLISSRGCNAKWMDSVTLLVPHARKKIWQCQTWIHWSNGQHHLLLRTFKCLYSK